MYMTLEANYAVRIVELLARDDVKLDAKTIATESEVPVRFALKILRKLVSSDIICSFKGSKGGYKLNGEPSEITLRRVIEAVEGPFTISRCQNTEYNCSKQKCKLHDIYSEISKCVVDKLDTYTFDNICIK